MRPASRARYVESPNELSQVVIWSYRDSRGRSARAVLKSTFRSDASHYDHLVPEGPWSIDASWTADDRIQLRLTPHSDDALPFVEPVVHGIAIDVVR